MSTHTETETDDLPGFGRASTIETMGTDVESSEREWLVQVGRQALAEAPDDTGDREGSDESTVDSDELRALRARVKELEREVDEKEATIERMQELSGPVLRDWSSVVDSGDALDGVDVSSRTITWLAMTDVTPDETTEWTRLCAQYPQQHAALWRWCGSTRTDCYRRIVQCLLDAGEAMTYDELDEAMGDDALSRAKLSKRTSKLADAGLIIKGGCPALLCIPDIDVRRLAEVVLRWLDDLDDVGS